jgi:hypothetical protein
MLEDGPGCEDWKAERDAARVQIHSRGQWRFVDICITLALNHRGKSDVSLFWSFPGGGE